MVTIANYLNGSFLAAEANESQRPVCLLQGWNDTQARRIWSYTIKRSIDSNRHHVIVDFGISYIKKLISFKTEVQNAERPILKLGDHSSNQYVLLGSALRKNGGLSKCISLLNSHIQSHKLGEAFLTIQGLLSLEPFYSQQEILHFVGSLSELHKGYKQVNILSSRHLSKLFITSLERQSTCIISLTNKLDNVRPQWKCLMIIRRFTGFSNEQDYVIELVEGQLKVTKHKEQQKAEQPQHTDMGFSFKRSAKPQELEKLKKIMYPYLNKQQDEKTCCTNKACSCEQPQIVLDDEQEEDDDVDV